MQSQEPALSQESEPVTPTRTRLDDLRIFRPDFYKEFHPRTALDMVLKTPGFQLDLGSGGRGLKGAAGNVLIDGVRPPAKASPVTEALGAIPADEVVAIILVPAGTLDIDMASHPLLINVIRVAKTGVEWGSTLKATQRGGQGSNQQAAADARWTSGQRVVSLNASQSRSESIIRGSITAPIAGQSAARETAGTRGNTDSTQLSATGQWTGVRCDQLQLRVNLSEQSSISQPLPVSSPDALSASGDLRASTHEFAAEWQRPLKGSAVLAVTGLYTRSQSDASSLLEVSGTQSASTSESETGETALRGEVRGHINPQLAYQVGADYAANFLNGDFGYSVDGTLIDIPGSASEVSEQRSGLFGSTTWTPNATWTTEAALRWERSTLSNSSATDTAYTFDDWLPRLTTSWIPKSGHKVQVKAERVVGQLAFSQFLAAVQLEDQIIIAGADTLQPERSWIYGLDYEHRFGERGLLSAGLKREHIDNPIESIPVDDQSEISANVSPATINRLKLDFSAPLEKVGLRGGLLSASFAQTLSQTRDPVTGQSRSVSGVSPELSAQVSLRQTLAKGAWGVSGSNEQMFTLYGVRQISQLRQSPMLSLFGEWRPRTSLAARVTVAAPSRSESEAVLYASPRFTGQSPNLIYISTSRQNPSWQAKLEWEPHAQTLLELAVVPKGETTIVGRTVSSDSAAPADMQHSVLQADTTVSAQLKVRW